MPKWLREPSVSDVEVHMICYERIMQPGTGFQFECSPEGEINEAKLTAESRRRLSLCRKDQFGDYRSPQIIKTHRPEHVQGVLQCWCGAHHEVNASRMTLCVVCKRTYNPHGVEVEMEEDGHGY